MEDISRELEKEIAQSKPKPYKKNRVSRILIVDDFGKMKSGEYLKLLVRGLCVISLVCFIASILFYYLYTDVSKKAGTAKTGLEIAQKQVETLTGEKEVLMARLVMLGKEPGVKPQPSVAQKETDPAVKDRDKTGSSKKEPLPVAAKVEKTIEKATEKQASVAVKKKDAIFPELNPVKETTGSATQPETTMRMRAENNIVAIEKFTVIKDGDNGDLLVRFDIRNISKAPGDVSGRIFTVLKPENQAADQWLVVPSAPLKNGIPSEYRKGQYFSIAHFKPVKFRIKNTAGPDFFKTAAIYIFNSKGGLIFEELIEITEAEQPAG